MSILEVLLKILAVVAVTMTLAGIQSLYWKKNPSAHKNLVRKFIHSIVQAAIYLFGIVACIGIIPQLNKVTSTLLAGSGIIAIGVTLAAQESLSNIISGMFVTLFKPFEIGNRIVLRDSGITGTVEDVTLRHTIIRTFSNTRIIIPNSTMNKEIIENSHIIDNRMSNFIDVDVAYESDIERAMEIVADVIGSHPLYLDVRKEEDKERLPKVRVFVRKFADSGVSLRASMWTHTLDENFLACSEARLGIKKAFDKAGIEIPYTKYTIITQGKKQPDQTSESELSLS